MKPLIIFVLALMSGNFENKLVGRWQKISPSGNITGVVFKEDNSFEGYINKKPFVTGTYTIRDSIFTMQDNGCNGATGNYKIIFFSNNDSFRLQLIQDDCEPRGRGASSGAYGRVKSND